MNNLIEAFISAHISAKAISIGANSNYKSRPTKPIIDYYCQLAAERLKTTQLIFMNSEDRRVANERFRIWTLLRKNYGYSLPTIGKAFGRDHSTVLYGIRKLEKETEMSKTILQKQEDWELARKMVEIHYEARSEATGTLRQRETARMIKVLEYVREFDSKSRGEAKK